PLSLFLLSSAQEVAFLKKYNTLISTYLKTNTPKLVNLVADGIVALKSRDQIQEEVTSQMLGWVPKDKSLCYGCSVHLRKVSTEYGVRTRMRPTKPSNSAMESSFYLW
ncbi:hypothetical protein PENTCL1PPCAC_17338, partial [Pristionchus entomophagus]